MIQTAQDMKTYKDRIKAALGNRFLRKALDDFASAYPVSRAKAFEGIDLDSLKDQIAEGKDLALTQLESLFHQFKARAEAAGAIVHLA
ncbi:MAG: (Fe-S)-binding protein, partial [Desulfatirhabdiaceae bacterium]|nr:(Fe-S)-binding protein [Desulfatirhabdiaceae bacterium]